MNNKENRLIYKNPNLGDFKEHYYGEAGGNSEFLKEKIKRLDAINQIFEDSEKLDKAEFQSDVNLSDGNGKKIFNNRTQFKQCSQIAHHLYPDNGWAQDLQATDLMESCSEAEVNRKINEEITHKPKAGYETVRFFKLPDETKFHVILIDKDGGNMDVALVEIKSSTRKKFEEKREDFKGEITKKRKELTKLLKEQEKAEKGVSQAKMAVEAFTTKESARLKGKYSTETITGLKNGSSIIYRDADIETKPWTLLRVDTQFESEKFKTSIWRTTPDGEAVKVDEWEENDKPKMPTNQQISDALEDMYLAGAEKPSKELEKKEATTTHIAKKRKEEKVEKEYEAKVAKKDAERAKKKAVDVELKTKNKKIKSAEIAGTPRVLTITTTKGSKFEYKEHLLTSGTAIWEYLGKDTDKKVGEFYLDNGKRVNPDGTAFTTKTAEKKKHLESGLVPGVKITRNETKEPETKVTLSKKANENIENLSDMVPAIVSIANDHLQDAFKKEVNERDLIRNLRRITPMLRARKEINKLTFTVHGHKLDWNKKEGFGYYASILETAHAPVSKDKIRGLKDKGINIVEPAPLKKLEVLEYENILRAQEKFEEIIANGTDKYTIFEELKVEVGRRLNKALAKSTIKKIEFAYKGQKEHPLTWELKKPNSGFANEMVAMSNVVEMKRNELGDESEEFAKFQALTVTKHIENKRLDNRKRRVERYRRRLQELVTKMHAVDSKIVTMSKEKFMKNWVNFKGRKGTIERVLTKPPFSYHAEEIPGIIHGAFTEYIGINEGTYGGYGGVNFNNLYKVTRPRIAASLGGKLPGGLLGERPPKEDTDFSMFGSKIPPMPEFKSPKGKDLPLTDEIERLLAIDPAEMNSGDAARLEMLFDHVVTPYADVLTAMSTLHYDPKAEGKESKEELPEEQKKLNKGLKKLCNFKDTPAAGWERFMGWLSGREKNITLQTMDGQKFKMNEGIFMRHNNPKAAFDDLRNTKGLYDPKSKPKTLRPDAVVKEVNKLLKLGYANMEMAKEEEGVVMKKFVTVKNFGEFNEQQMLAFQLGYIVEQAAESDMQLQEAMDIISKSQNPVKRNFLQDLLYRGLSPEDLQKVDKDLEHRSSIAGGAGTNITIENGEINMEKSGMAAVIIIPLSDGTSLQIFGAKSFKGKGGDIGLGVTASLYKGDKVEWSTSIGVSFKGIGVGTAVTIDFLGGKLTISGGIGLGYNGAMSAGAGILHEFQNMEKKGTEKIQKDLDASGYKDLWTTWKALPRHNVEAKFEALKAIKPLWDEVRPIMKSNDLTERQVVFMLDMIKNQITTKALEDLSRFFITHLGVYAGVGATGVSIIPTVGIHIGDVEIYIPNRREIAKVLSQVSDLRVRDELLKAEQELNEALEKGETPKGVFTERTADMVYDAKTGRVMTLKDRNNVDLNLWMTDLDTYNKTLAKAEIEVNQTGKNLLELTVHNVEDKDALIINDPGISTLAIVRDGNRLFLEGDINDLIISRERFKFTHELREGGPTIRDRIVIRKKASVLANEVRDIDFMLDNSSHVLEKNMGDDSFGVRLGDMDAGGYYNILEVAGYSSGDLDDLEGVDKDIVEFYKGFTPDMSARIDKKKAAKYARNIDAREKAMGTISKDEFEKQKVRENLFPELDKLYKTREFFREFRKVETIGGNVDSVSKLIVKYAKKTKGLKGLNENELIKAVNYLENKWFTQVAEKKDGKEEIRKRIDARADWLITKVFKPKFEAARTRMEPKPEFSNEVLLKKLRGEVYDNLLENMTNADFKFEGLGVTPIPKGSRVESGSRGRGEKGTEGALAKNVSYETMAKPEELIHGYGLLDITRKELHTNVKGTSEEARKDRELARMFLEILSPMPKEDAKFLSSPLAKLIANTATHELLVYDNPEDSRLITELYENPQANLSKPAHKEALGRFKKLIKEIRTKQIQGKSFIKKIGNTGLKVRISMKTEMAVGAYSKCANLTPYIKEVGHISVVKGVKSLYKETTELTDHRQSKAFVSWLVAGGITASKSTEPDTQGGKRQKNSFSEETPATADATKAEAAAALPSDAAKPTTDTGHSAGANFAKQLDKNN